MTRVERRDKEPEPTKEPVPSGGKISRRQFLGLTGTGLAGLAIGSVVGREVFPKEVVVPVAEPAPGAEPVEGEAPAESKAVAGFTLVFDPVQCTGCMKCAVACSEKYGAYFHPEETKNTVNLEFSRIRPMRFQYVDVLNNCHYCQLMDWAEGSTEFPCAAVCPEQAIITVPEGEGEASYFGMGYKWIDQEKCLGIDKCWRCAEICEDQFASGISFDPISRKAQVCSRCGGDPECVKACPEPLALQWVPLMRNGRFYAQTPTAYAELLYRKMYNTRREL